MAKKEKNNTPKKESTVLPIIIGVLVVAALAGVILFFANYKSDSSEGESLIVATKESEGDGEIIDYESKGALKLADYSKLEVEKEKDDKDEDLISRMWEEYTEKCTVNEYPDGYFEEAVRDAKMEYAGFASATGVSYEELLESYGMDESTVNDVAGDTVEGRMIAATIAAKENLKLTDELEEKYLMSLMEYEEKEREPLADLEEDYMKGYSGRYKDDCIVEMVKEWLFKNKTTVKGS
ncbi:MAG: hypothetical protein K5639_04425 [Eubacterium sp.]|nr:hypothetical protein [Eubacterium sp.]